LKYSQERKAFGKKFSKHQAIAFKLADMATQIMAAKMLCLKAAAKRSRNGYFSIWCYGKIICFSNGDGYHNEAVQIHGGNGYVAEYHVERMMRDAKITQIYEGLQKYNAL
jgi:alkylation response protein AidB-like acyl-CoA dehydrogenase